jgi:hypothetical protein
MERPPSGRGAELRIPGVDVGTMLEKQFDHLAMTVQSRIVQRCRAVIVFQMDGAGINCDELAHSYNVSRRDSRKQFCAHI